MRLDFGTAGLPSGDRLSRWHAIMSGHPMAVEVSPQPGPDFSGTLSVFGAGECSIAIVRASRQTVSRSEGFIRRTSGDYHQLFLQVSGDMVARADGKEYLIGPGDLFFYDASVPHQLRLAGAFEHIVLRVPRDLVKQNWRTLDQRGCFRLAAEEPLARITAAVLSAVARDIDVFSDPDLLIVVQALFDVFACAASKCKGSITAKKGRGSDVTFARARAVIQTRLKDFDLTPDRIAIELGMSRRALNKLFEHRGITPMEYVVLERLEHAARDLSSSAQRGHSVTEIALRWGFKNVSHFSKRFRQQYGSTPSALRGG